MPSNLTGEFWTCAFIDVCGSVEESSVYECYCSSEEL